jgi:iron complex transport system permease protein
LLSLIAVMGLCALVGEKAVSLQRVFAAPAAAAGENIDREILLGVRLPRVILAAVVGAALACSGIALQAILRNPLAEPYILGISSGAGLGVIIAIIFGVTSTLWAGSPVALFALGGAVGTVWLVWWVGRFTAKSQPTSLLLAGVVVNAFFSAVIMFLTSIAKSDQLQSTVFWLMGNITGKDTATLTIGSACILAGVIALSAISNRLNVITFGDDQARSLGVNPGATRFAAFAFAAFITAVAVSLSGLIGFVGLVVPHAVRLVLGPDHRQLLPLGAISGAAFLVVADTIARTIIAPAQLPVGVITAIAGGPFFLLLLGRYCRKGGHVK